MHTYRNNNDKNNGGDYSVVRFWVSFIFCFIKFSVFLIFCTMITINFTFRKIIRVMPKMLQWSIWKGSWKTWESSIYWRLLIQSQELAKNHNAEPRGKPLPALCSLALWSTDSRSIKIESWWKMVWRQDWAGPQRI
jgi:hypothetical protein